MEGSMKEEEELQFHRLWEKRQDELRGIIPVTGPPTTCKTELAEVIGRWAKCPTLCIQDFFSPRTTAATIIHHNSHPPHFLSLPVTYQSYRCRACGEHAKFDFAYSCRPCGLYYHLRCALLPLQLLRHQHGGHQHVMRLLYSHHDTDQPDEEEEEAYWCDVCGDDMDPHNWCYSCKDCPYYSVHLHCARADEYLRYNVRDSVFVPQIQSQLEAVMAEVSSVDSKTPPGNY